MCRKASAALEELFEHLRDLKADVPDVNIPTELLENLPPLRSGITPISSAVDELAVKVQSSGHPLILDGTFTICATGSLSHAVQIDEYASLVSAVEHLTRIKEFLRRWATESTPLLSRYTRPVLLWLEDRTPQLPDLAKDQDVASPREVIDSMLLSVQSILAVRNSVQDSEDEERENYIRDDSRLACKLSEKLGVSAVLNDLESLMQHLAHLTPKQVQMTLARVLPFLQRYLVLVDAQVRNHANWSKALFKLNFTLCSIVGTLAKDGFCQPRDTEGAEEGAEGTETMEGTGLGEGSGSTLR